MKRLSEDFRRMLEGLAHQDAADYLSMRDKYRQLGIGREREQELAARASLRGRRVALVSDGQAAGSHIDYAVDACRRQHAGLDIVLHGNAGSDSDSAQRLLGRVRGQGIDTRLVELKGNDVQALGDYVAQRPSLLLLVAQAGDVLSRAFTDSVASRAQRLHVPLVVIEEKVAQPLGSLSFA